MKAKDVSVARLSPRILVSQLVVSVKSDSSLIFKKLSELHSIHRIIMTGVSLTHLSAHHFDLLTRFRRRR